MLTRMRIWLPDAPGVLGAVAAEIGAVHGNVVGLEVLEREAGVAIDELVVELPDVPGAVDAVCKGIHTIAGAGVEEAVDLFHDVCVGASAAGDPGQELQHRQAGCRWHDGLLADDALLDAGAV